MTLSNIKKIVSGGQSGVDRAALDVALQKGIPCGGWCPRDRKAEDGIIPDYYPLKETKADDYEVRTRLNISDSDATLILYKNSSDAGTQSTHRIALELHKPVLAIDLSLEMKENKAKIVSWVKKYCLKVINIAGPRESNSPGIYEAAYEFLKSLMASAAG